MTRTGITAPASLRHRLGGAARLALAPLSALIGLGLLLLSGPWAAA